jgi:CHAD domain-containing protein
MVMNFALIEPRHLFIQRYDVLATLTAAEVWDTDSLHQFRVNLRACLAWQPLWQITALHGNFGCQVEQWRSLLKSVSRQRNNDVFHTYLQGLPHSRALCRKLRRQATTPRKPPDQQLQALLLGLQQMLSAWQQWMTPLLFQQQLAVVRAIYVAHIRESLQQGLQASQRNLHGLRLTIKALRYLLDLIATVAPDYQALCCHCRLWQDKLGHFADLDALARWLKRQEEPALAALVRGRRRVLAKILWAEREDIEQLLTRVMATQLPDWQQLALVFGLRTDVRMA